MMRRVWPVVLVSTVCAGSHADDLSNARAMMASALLHLNGQRNAIFLMNGQVETGRQLQTFSINAAWQSANGVAPAMLDANLYENSVLTGRFVADSEYFWTFNGKRNEYSAAEYRTQPSLCQLFKSQARGMASPLSQLISDAFGKIPTAGSTNQWTPWMPMSKVKIEGTTIFLRTGDPATKEMAIELTPPDPDAGQMNYIISRVDYWEQAWIGKNERVTTWNIQFHTNVRAFDPGTFVFIPPRGARAISRPAKKADG